MGMSRYPQHEHASLMTFYIFRCVCVCEHHTYVVPWWSEYNIGCPVAGIVSCCEVLCGCQELNPLLWEECQVLLTVDTRKMVCLSQITIALFFWLPTLLKDMDLFQLYKMWVYVQRLRRNTWKGKGHPPKHGAYPRSPGGCHVIKLKWELLSFAIRRLLSMASEHRSIINCRTLLFVH